MKLDLSGKTAFITGGNIGIGRAISLKLAQAGADVALTYYSHPEAGEAGRPDALPHAGTRGVHSRVVRAGYSVR